MKDSLLIARSFKKTLIYIDKIVEVFPNKETVLRDNILKTNYEILELIYFANEIDDRSLYQRKIIAKLKMLDFYLSFSTEKGYISHKKYEKVGNYLIEIIQLVKGWMKVEKSE